MVSLDCVLGDGFYWVDFGWVFLFLYGGCCEFGLLGSGCLGFVLCAYWVVGNWFNWVVVGLCLRFYAALILR